MSLEMRGACERCEKPLAADGPAVICSFECTFCADCAAGVLGGVCPNCGGNMVQRPIRPVAALGKSPASTTRSGRRQRGR